MVEIIPEPNKDLNKSLFLKELANTDGIDLEITRVSDALASNRNKNEDYINVEFKIVNDFTGKFVLNDDGTVKDKSINIKDNIIKISFTLGESDAAGKYSIGNKRNLFSILNSAMISKNMIPYTNNSGFKANYDEIASALADFKFKGVGTYVKSKDFNDYYRLDVKGD